MLIHKLAQSRRSDSAHDHPVALAVFLDLREKALTADERALAAEPFGAAGACLTVAKKLIDMRHPAVRNLTAVRGKIEAYWASCTLAFPEVTIRLLPLDQIAKFERQMHDFAFELADAASELGRIFDDLKQEAEGRLGALYDASDFPHAPQNLVERLVGLSQFRRAAFQCKLGVEAQFTTSKSCT